MGYKRILQNLDAWMQAMRKDKFVEIGKSFRHEGDPPYSAAIMQTN
jgi:hypothetical protein